MLKKVASKALEVNLQRTATTVVIPSEQGRLLEILSEWYGIRQETQKLLEEMNHRYIAWEQTLNDLHHRAINDFPYYAAHPLSKEAVRIYHSLYHQVAQKASSPEIRKVGVNRWVGYCEKVVGESGPRLESHLQATLGALDLLSGVAESYPQYFVPSIGSLKRLLEVLTSGPDLLSPLTRRTSRLLATGLEACYEEWLRREDPLVWFRNRGLGEGAPEVLEGLQALSHEGLRGHLTGLRELEARKLPLRSQVELLRAFPGPGEISRGYLNVSAALGARGKGGSGSLSAKMHWLSFILRTAALAPVHEMALREVRRCYLEALRGSHRGDLEEMIHETFEILRREEIPFSQSVADLITTIGLEVMKSGDPELTDRVILEIVNSDFQSPGFEGFNEQWEARVNPFHLLNIRTYLKLIEANPQLTRRLLAALVVQLKIGGVFMSDADLFQKDISRLLRGDIEPVYHQVKHLLKLFPVYFNDIGAEGELREVSTRIDEVHERKDPLCHFLRKQCHVESNLLLVPFVDAIARFWTTGDPLPLRQYVPPGIYESLASDVQAYEPLQTVLLELMKGEDLEVLFQEDPEVLGQRLSEVKGSDAVSREKVQLLLRLRQLLRRKYDLSHGDLLEQMRSFAYLKGSSLEELEQALNQQDEERALVLLLDVLEQLKGLILSREETQAIEDIYHKRHVAVGIPSLYGRYLEPKFQAMGLTFRIESLANTLFERMIARQNLEYINKSTLQKICGWLKLMLRALRIDGCRGEGLRTGISMLEKALEAQACTVDQYINVFQLLSNGVKYLIRVRFFDVYEVPLQQIMSRMMERGLLEQETRGRPEALLGLSESFLRDIISESFGLQRLDGLLAKIVQTLTEETEKLDRTTLNLLMTYDVDRCFSAIHDGGSRQEGSILLGFKGYLITELAKSNFPIPPGFILTTEVFRCQGAVKAYPGLSHEQVRRIERELLDLQKKTGRRLGDPENPLLLSVRSSGAISMPGMLDTFLNVGINEEIAGGFGRRTGSPWAGWDAYRRFLQFWGMSFGISRDLFDGLMRQIKEKYSVQKKSQLLPEQMRELALLYRELLRGQGVEIIDSPFDQLLKCVELVLLSWFSDRARIYRSEMQIAEEWGTAVLVQKMVYGNLSDRSGTGVVFTRHPRHSSQNVELYGDFMIQGQGDDVVSGLVKTFPITEQQRLSEEKGPPVSLEKDFPAIYRSLLEYAGTLITGMGMHPQEIEFTFESDKPEDLHLLQTRDLVFDRDRSVSTFVGTQQLEESRVTRGIGVGGGALSGRVAHRAEDVLRLRDEFPGDPIILLRPDTVPDDIPLILKADGVLTALGGATSHAAVAAHRLGKTCVVGCRRLEVNEDQGVSRLAGHSLSTGEFVSINGMEGSVYLGRHEVNSAGAYEDKKGD